MSQSVNKQIKLAPIYFVPYLKEVIWGGSKICEYKGIAKSGNQIGESWEVSAIPGRESIVAKGSYKGFTLPELIDRFGAQLLGQSVYSRYNGKFPLLIKLIDANDNLSIQVHPDDELAMHRHGTLGKTEMWYIISTDNNAKIYSGLKACITPEIYEAKVADGTFPDVVAVHNSNPGDVFFLPAGRIHTIGTGNLLAEIQESSDITYRIYDYGRTDSYGKSRELHTEMAKGAINFTDTMGCGAQPAPKDIPDTEIANCTHFRVRQILANGNTTLQTDPGSFTVIMCINGYASVICPDGNANMQQGKTVLLPAMPAPITINGNATLLVTQA